jgi:hypothetical protein
MQNGDFRFYAKGENDGTCVLSPGWLQVPVSMDVSLVSLHPALKRSFPVRNCIESWDMCRRTLENMS